MSLPINARERSQVMVIFALFVVLLMVPAGSGFDYASIVADDARLQNAVDAAALAGANALSRNAALADPGPAAEAVARTYLTQNGVVAGATTTIDVTFPLNPVTTKKENISLKVTRQHPTFFWKLIGINQVTMRVNGTAHSARAMLDIVLSLDTTASMYLAGGTTRNDFQSLRDAVDGFIQQVNPSDSDQRGPKISVARFAGMKCKWSSKAADTPHGDNHSLIDVTNAVGRLDEYTQGCTDDMEVLTDLTNRQPDLRQIANASGSVACPAGANPVAACPLQHVWNMAPKVTLSGTDDFDQLRDAVVMVINQVDPDSSDPTTSKLGIARWAGIKCVYSGSSYVAPCQDDKTLLSPLTANKSDLLKIASGDQSHCPLPSAIKVYGCPLNHVPYTAPGQSILPYTGTKIPNAFTVVKSSSYYSWSTSNGGRDKAQKVMVLITDGQNEESPAGNFPQSISDYDRDMQTLATNLKPGKDPVDPSRDVEIFVVGFFCAPYSSSSSGTGQFCKSKLADTSEAARPCPTGAWPPASVTPSSIDTKLRNLSSSATGTCDHYFPLKKTDSLPELMQTLAKRFAGVRLTG